MSLNLLFVASIVLIGDSPDPAAKGPYRTGVVTVDFIDADRNGRVLKTEIWYPTDADPPTELERYPATTVVCRSRRNAKPLEGPFPLLVFSHGLTGTREQSTYLAEHLASHGYVIASADHQYNTRRDFRATEVVRSAIDRPRDVRLLIDRMLAKGADEADLFSKRLDKRRIGVLGHSFGGYTALAVGGALADARTVPDAVWPPDQPDDVDFFDERVRAVVAFAPLCQRVFNEAGMTRLRRPTLIFAASDDRLTPFESNQSVLFKNVGVPCYLAKIEGATHFTFANEEMIQTANVLARQLHHPTIPRDRSDRIILGKTLAFLDRYVSGEDRFGSVLTVSDGDVLVSVKNGSADAPAAREPAAKRNLAGN